MKKIMFDDRCGLTDAVLDGIKTMTRRPVGNRMAVYHIKAYLIGYTELANKCAQYKIGEVVAVAQSYKDILGEEYSDPTLGAILYQLVTEDNPGWNNKMFVRADLMPHKIRITDIKVERLQDISDEDCMEEGVMWDYDDYPTMSHKVYLINDHEAFSTPRQAFAALIDKVSGKGTWERNPWVFAYSFELVK